MATVFGGWASDVGGTTGTVVLTGVPSGATIVAICVDGDGASTSMSASDSVAGSMVAATDYNGNTGVGIGLQAFVLTGATAGTHTITLNAVGDAMFHCMAGWVSGFGGVDNSGAAKGGAALTGVTSGANGISAGSITPANNGCLIVAVAQNGSNGDAFTAGTTPNAFTLEFSTADSFLAQVESFTQTTAAAINPTFGIPSSINTSTLSFALTPTGGGGGPTETLTGGKVTSASGAAKAASSKAVAGNRFAVGQGLITASGADAITAYLKRPGPGISPDYNRLFQAGKPLSNVSGATPNLTGKAIISAAGTVSKAALFAVPQVGNKITSAVGTLTASIGGNLNLTLAGAAITSASGAVTQSQSAPLLGAAIASGVGTVAYSTGGSPVNVTLAGAKITSGLHSLTFGGVQLVPTGQVVTGFQGTVTATGGNGLNLSLSGNAAAFGTGHLYRQPIIIVSAFDIATLRAGGGVPVNGGTDLTPGLIGQMMTSGLGTLTAHIAAGANVTVSLVGALVTSRSGVTGTAKAPALIGSSIVSGAGSIAALEIRGLMAQITSIRSSAGTLTASASNNFALSGLSIASNTGNVGTLIAGNVVVALVGAAITSNQGNPRLSIAITQIGTAVVSSAGAVTASSVATVIRPLTGAKIQSTAGVPKAGNAQAPVGIRAQTNPGNVAAVPMLGLAGLGIVSGLGLIGQQPFVFGLTGLGLASAQGQLLFVKAQPLTVTLNGCQMTTGIGTVSFSFKGIAQPDPHFVVVLGPQPYTVYFNEADWEQ